MSKAKLTQAVSLFSTIDQTNSSPVKKAKKAKSPKSDFSSSKDLLSCYQMTEQNKHITHEFQSFGCHLAEVLADKRHTSLYIKLAKTVPRGLLERALSFVIDSAADSKAKLFMWKLGQLQKSEKIKQSTETKQDCGT
ncbi:MAG TPA: hypothetical protein PLQ50_01205 [Candidatus Woesebacteria bacterium]|nr:hypothetical protein [Candidatus Woesebacteria bacterium]